MTASCSANAVVKAWMIPSNRSSTYGWGVTTNPGVASFTARLVVAGVVIAAAACGGKESPGPGGEEARSAGERVGAGTPAAAVCPPADQPLEVTVGNETRQAIVRIPDGASAPLPAVVLVHGFASQADEFVQSSGITEPADEARAAVIAPQGMGDPTGWNVLAGFEADDAFVTSLLDELAEAGCIDPDRLAIGGHSAGAAFAAFYGCAHPERFSAVLLNAGLPPPICGDGTPNLVITHGVDDPVVPFDGGDQPVGDSTIALRTVPESAASWADQAGCGAAEDPGAEGSVTWTRWPDCADGTSVGLAAISGWGHSWPTSGSSAGLDAGCVLIASALTGAPPQDPTGGCP